MDLDLIVKGGTVVNGTDTYRADVGVAGEKVAALGVDLGTAPRTVNATGKYLLPGAIDVHTHFEMPFMGTYTADDFRTGTGAAAAGGITTVDRRTMRPSGKLRECRRRSSRRWPTHKPPALLRSWRLVIRYAEAMTERVRVDSQLVASPKGAAGRRRR
jgi:hypothetical protein